MCICRRTLSHNHRIVMFKIIAHVIYKLILCRLFTSGESAREYAEAARNLKDQGVTINSVGEERLQKWREAKLQRKVKGGDCSVFVGWLVVCMIFLLKAVVYSCI